MLYKTLEEAVSELYIEELEDNNDYSGYIGEKYEPDELDEFVGKVFNQQKVETIYRKNKYGASRLFARTSCIKCGRTKRVFLSNLVNDPEKYGSCICSDENINSRIDSADAFYTGKKVLPNNTSGYTGVSFVRTYKGEPYNKWRAYIEVNGVRTYLGDFESKAKAIRVRRLAGENGVKWYKDNHNRIIRDLRKKTEKFSSSKYIEKLN